MSGWISDDYSCISCGYLWDVVRPREDRDKPLPCPSCGCPDGGYRALAAPAVMNHAKPDSYRRGEDYQLLKRAARTEQKMMNLPPEKRGEMQAEINTLRQKARTTRGKTTDKPD